MLFGCCRSGITRECRCGVTFRCGNKDISPTSPETLECWRTFNVKTKAHAKCCECAVLESKSICSGCKTQHCVWKQVQPFLKERTEFVNAWILGCRKPVEFFIAKQLTNLSKNPDHEQDETFKSNLHFLNDLVGVDLENLSQTRDMLDYYIFAKAGNRQDILKSKESFIRFFELNQRSKVGSQSDENSDGQSTGPSPSPADPVQVPSPLHPSEPDRIPVQIVLPGPSLVLLILFSFLRRCLRQVQSRSPAS
jgi:hypothetical protein